MQLTTLTFSLTMTVGMLFFTAACLYAELSSVLVDTEVQDFVDALGWPGNAVIRNPRAMRAYVETMRLPAPAPRRFTGLRTPPDAAATVPGCAPYAHIEMLPTRQYAARPQYIHRP